MENLRNLRKSALGVVSLDPAALRTLQQPLQNQADWKKISQARQDVHWKRLIQRTKPFYQSDWEVNVRCVERENDAETRWAKRSLMFRDWFDFILSIRTTYLVVTVAIGYTLAILFWALMYMAIDCEASMPRLSMHEAFAFSLETATTVGYTLVRDSNDMFFGGCNSWLIVVYFQAVFSTLLNGFVLGLVMTRLQRGNRRSRQIVFSNKACILCVRGRFYFMFHVVDLTTGNPIIGVTVRLLAVFHEPSDFSPAFFQTRMMRVTRPDDELGAKLWLTVPAVVMHEIDAWSPLAPVEIFSPPKVAESSVPTRFPQPSQRGADSRIGSRQHSTCPICGNTFSTEAALRRHVAFTAEDEMLRGQAENFGHRALDPKDVSRPVVNRSKVPKTENNDEAFEWIEPSVVRESIRDRLASRRIEIIALVEGLDPHTSNAMQARHSYTIDDIEFDKQLAPCVVTGLDGGARVNLSLFHTLYPYDAANVENPIPFASHT